MENTYKPEWNDLCRSIDYRFRKEELLQLVLTHKSYTHIGSLPGERNNERLEFLGDAILDMVISEMLMERFPELDEGGLSKFRASLVNEDGLSRIAAGIGLGPCLLMGKGEELSGGRAKTSLLADALEALFAGIYLDSREYGGISDVARVIRTLFESELPEQAESFISHDYKSELQEFIQKTHGISANYELVNQTGPDHQKEFEMAVRIDERELGRGRGYSKKQAGQAAAQNALRSLRSPLEPRAVEN